MLSRQWSLALSLSSTAISAVAAQDCVPWYTSGLAAKWPSEDYTPLCLDPDAQAEVSFEFESLFPDGVKFVYAIQTYNDEEILDLATEEYLLDEPEDLQNAAVWFEYSRDSYNASAERLTVFSVDFAEGFNGTSEGGNGGCDGLMGKECADALRDALQEQLWESTYPQGRRPKMVPQISVAWRSIVMSELPSCPNALGDVSIYQEKRIAFETEDEDEEAQIFPSGNASWAYETLAQENTFEAERAKTAFGIVAQFPWREELIWGDVMPEEKWFTVDDIHVQLLCVRHDKGGSGSGGDDEGNNDDSSSSNGQDDSGDGDSEDSAPGSLRVSLVSIFLGVAVAGLFSMQ